MTRVIDETLLIQTAQPPFDSQDNASRYLETLARIITWDEVVIFTDDQNKNLVLILREAETIVSAMRFNFPQDDLVKIISGLCAGNKMLKLAVLQGAVAEEEHIAELPSLTNLLSVCRFQTLKVTVADIRGFLSNAGIKKGKGRGAKITKATADIVWRDSHGRCMFTGCAERLGMDALTGENGNFSYLAHNVASSERGERGIALLSDRLSDEASNILLMCDKHHRLVDKVAGCNYPASRLSQMREDHCQNAECLLDALGYEPVDVYVLLWPVNAQVVSAPGAREIAASLGAMKMRAWGPACTLDTSGDASVRRPERFMLELPEIINLQASRVIDQTRAHNYRAALFAFGPVPALVGLGARLGNKGQFLPMLRYRDGGCWMWPRDDAGGLFWIVEDLPATQSCDEMVICINFTAQAPRVVAQARKLQEQKGCRIINYTAKSDYMGNGSVPHPADGIAFCSQLQRDLLEYRSAFGVRLVHLLVCASNAASVFTGQAFDRHHPDLLVYDFDNEGMRPALLISHDTHGVRLSLPDKESDTGAE